jgi:hypothetical protein
MITMNHNPNHMRTMFYNYDRMKKTITEEQKNLTDGCAEEFKELLIQNIMMDKFAGGYRPLSPKYKEWKQKHGGLPGFWKLWGELYNAISLRDTPKGTSVGIERDVLPARTSSLIGQDTFTPIWKYAYYNEYGYGTMRVGFLTRDQAKRPVFHPTQVEYKAIFWEKRANKSLNKFRGVWSGRIA